MNSITVSGTLDCLTSIREFVDRMAHAADLDGKAGYRLRLAVDEIATNIVNHGYLEAGRTGGIRIEGDIDETTLTISLVDSGVPFDPTAAEPPDNLDEPLEARPIGGLGIFLATTGVDDFRYERVEDQNLTVFVMKRPAAIQSREAS